ncbi:hypothetical protein CA831_37075 [Burkholderia multivorans]|nr:hypothetical protein CA831_37075 [Burkholderia multivorans]
MLTGGRHGRSPRPRDTRPPSIGGPSRAGRPRGHSNRPAAMSVADMTTQLARPAFRHFSSAGIPKPRQRA